MDRERRGDVYYSEPGHLPIYYLLIDDIRFFWA